jgi:hypothetical protein
MASLMKYEDAAAAFLQVYPLGTKVRGEEIIAWATAHSDGLASDLLIDDDTKRLSALRRHLNTGASSRSFAEDERFVINISDAKRKIFTVQRLADHVHDKAAAAFDRSVTSAMSPLKASLKAVEDIKLDELDDEDRAELEARVDELTKLQTPLKSLFKAQTVERWVLRLEAKGYSRDQALNIVELLPTLRREMKLIESLS